MTSEESNAMYAQLAKDMEDYRAAYLSALGAGRSYPGLDADRYLRCLREKYYELNNEAVKQ